MEVLQKRYFYSVHTGNSGCGHCIFIFTAVQRSYQFYFADNRVGEYGVGLVGRSEFGIPECGNSYYVEAVGFGVVLFLARMMSIDKTLYESADVDGATWFQKFMHITVPQTKSIIEFYVIITLIEMLSWVFNFIYVMTAGGPGNKTLVLEYLIYKKAFGGGDFNIAMAISVVLLAIAAILIVIHQIVMRKEE